MSPLRALARLVVLAYNVGMTVANVVSVVVVIGELAGWWDLL